MKDNVEILSTNSARHFHIGYSNISISKFPDGEIHLTLSENIKNKSVVLIASTQPPAENLLELLLTIPFLIKNRVKKIKVIIPYFAYARSDKENITDEALNAASVIRMLESVSSNKCEFSILDPHSQNLNKYFKSKYSYFNVVDELAKPFVKITNLTIVAPDLGSLSRAKRFAEVLNNKNVFSVIKKRINESKVKLISVSGILTKNALIVDDMVSSGSTILETAKYLKANGVKNIYVAVTHMVYKAGGWKRLTKSKIINKIYTTNSIASPKKVSDKIKVVDLSNILKKISYIR